MNKDYISNTLCINLNKPEVMCNGVCYLTDSLLKNHESDSDLPFPYTLELLTINFIVPEIVDFHLMEDNKVINRQITFYNKYIPKESFDEFFRPPEFV